MTNQDEQLRREAAQEILTERLQKESPDIIRFLLHGLPVTLQDTPGPGQVGGALVTINPENLPSLFYTVLGEYCTGQLDFEHLRKGCMLQA